MCINTETLNWKVDKFCEVKYEYPDTKKRIVSGIAIE